MNTTMSSSNIQGWAILAGAIGIFTTIFWMFVGWRAMRAHERLADAAERAARKMDEKTSGTQS